MTITAGCTIPGTSGPGPLVPDAPTASATADPSGPAASGTNLPAAAGTQAAGTCNADIANDPANCGGCGYACPANAICQQGQCFCREGYMAENGQCVVAPAGGTVTGTGCPAGMSPCPDGYCYELASSPENCGICGNMCPAGMTCTASTCTAIPPETTTAVPTTTAAVTTTSTPTGTTSPGLSFTYIPGGYTISCAVLGLDRCGDTCVNLSTSNGNCGSCGTICSGLKPTCCSGTCTSLKSDKANCGTCGHKCGTFATCENGSCKVKVGATSTLGVTQKITLKITQPIYQKPVDIPGIDF